MANESDELAASEVEELAEACDVRHSVLSAVTSPPTKPPPAAPPAPDSAARPVVAIVAPAVDEWDRETVLDSVEQLLARVLNEWPHDQPYRRLLSVLARWTAKLTRLEDERVHEAV